MIPRGFFHGAQGWAVVEADVLVAFPGGFVCGPLQRIISSSLTSGPALRGAKYFKVITFFQVAPAPLYLIASRSAATL